MNRVSALKRYVNISQRLQMIPPVIAVVKFVCESIATMSKCYAVTTLPIRYLQGGRQLLLDAALEAIKVAEDPATEENRVLMARSFHTATVYLEVLSSFNAVSSGMFVLKSCALRLYSIGRTRLVFTTIANLCVR